jgi:hypothetical protein
MSVIAIYRQFQTIHGHWYVDCKRGISLGRWIFHSSHALGDKSQIRASLLRVQLVRAIQVFIFCSGPHNRYIRIPAVDIPRNLR